MSLHDTGSNMLKRAEKASKLVTHFEIITSKILKTMKEEIERGGGIFHRKRSSNFLTRYTHLTIAVVHKFLFYIPQTKLNIITHLGEYTDRLTNSNFDSKDVDFLDKTHTELIQELINEINKISL
jgi:hypothetical protein